MKEQCKNSRLPHLLMIVVHGETLWSPAPQPMDDDDMMQISLQNSAGKVVFYGWVPRNTPWALMGVRMGMSKSRKKTAETS